MTAAIKTLLFSSLADANPASPPAGYTKPSGSDLARIASGQFVLTGATETIWFDNTPLTSATIYARVTLPSTVSTGAAGCCIIDSSTANGYEVITGTTAGNFRIFAVTAGKLSGGVLATFAVAPIGSAVVELSLTGTTLTVKQNSTTLGTLTSVTRPANPVAGAVSRTGFLVSMQSEYDQAQTVTSINGGSPITASQSSVSAITTGFTGLPTSITADNGITCSAITGSTNAPTWTQNVRTDGAVFPKSGTVVTYTFTKGAETANATQIINKDSTETEGTIVSPVLDDNTYVYSAIKTLTGRTAVAGDIPYYTIPAGMSDLVLAADGGITVTNAGTFTLWVWTNATGINYRYDVTVTEGGVVIGVSFKQPALGIGFGIGI